MKRKDFNSLSSGALRASYRGAAALLLTGGFGAIGIQIWSQPGGLVSAIARLLVQTCSITGDCDFYSLYPGFGLALLVLAVLAVYLMTLFTPETHDDAEQDSSAAERNAAQLSLLAGIHEKLARMEESLICLEEREWPAEKAS